MRAVLLSCGLACLAAGEIAAAELPPPLELTAEQDHKLMMEQARHQPRFARAPMAATRTRRTRLTTTSRRAIPIRSCPIALKLDNGKPVKNCEAVVEASAGRRSSSSSTARSTGACRSTCPAVSWAVKSNRATRQVGDRDVVMRKLVGHVDNSSYPAINVDIELYSNYSGGREGRAGHHRVLPGRVGGAHSAAADRRPGRSR